jgi:hypothetical protein
MDKNKVHIFDDFLPSLTVLRLEERIGRIPFRFAENKNTNVPKIKIKNSKITNINRPGLLQCIAFDSDWDYSLDLKWAESYILSSLPFKYELQRIKLNFNPQVKNKFKEKCMHPHCDMNEDGFTAIYYLNDSDGDTLIFNEKTMEPFLNGEELSIKQRVKNKRGRLVMFNQDYLHAGMLPIKSDYRIVINFNFKIL